MNSDKVSRRNFLKLAAVTASSLFLGACKSKSKYFKAPPAGLPPQGIQDTLESRIIDEKYDTKSQVHDSTGSVHEFTRFALEQAPILPGNPSSEDIDRMVVTIKDDSDNYHLFWFKYIDKIEKNGLNTIVHFKDGNTFEGKWVPNQEPVNFYNKVVGYASGMIEEDGQDAPRKIHITSIDSAVLDLTGSLAEFEKSYAEIFDGVKAKKTVELVDGTVYSTDLGYIIDCCGHWSQNNWHDRMMNRCELIEEDGIVRTVPLGGIQEIELTGEFDENFGQCRKAVIKYKDGSQELGSLNLTSESYSGVCNHSSRFRNWDKIILHNEKGALIIPLDNVRKIMPDEEYFDPSKTIQNKQMHEGVNLTSWWHNDYLMPELDNTLDKLFELGVESISLLTTWYQDSISSTAIAPSSTKTPTDQGIENAIAKVKALGMRTVLKPHIDLPDGTPGWRGEISFETEEDWTEWFANYNTFITHYAEIAENNNADMLVIGTELKKTTHRPEWSQIIDNIRAIYNGEIVYAANHDNYKNIPFLDKVDYLGVDAYFKLTDSYTPLLDELKTACLTIAQELKDFSELHGKKIMITEFGFQNYNGTNISPWNAPTKTIDEQEQADCFEAFFNACFNQDWCAGTYLWDVHWNMHDYDKFTPLGKLAEATVHNWYHKVDE